MAATADLPFIIKMYRETADENEAIMRKCRQCNDPDWAAKVDRGIIGCRRFADAIERPGITDADIVSALEEYCRFVVCG